MKTSSKTESPSHSLPCPECGAKVEVAADVLANEILSCEGCSAELEVASVDPLELELAPEVEEDWGE
jgi:alpha-aminoadipate carrier protein LysW